MEEEGAKRTIIWILGRITLVAISLTFGFVALMLISAYFEVSCSRRMVKEVMSPDHNRRYFLYELVCATVPVQTNVSIVDAATKTPPFGGPNAFSASGGSSIADGTDTGGVGVDVRWIDDHNVRIRYDRNVVIQRMADKVDDVVVTYEKVPFSLLEDEGVVRSGRARRKF